MDALEIRFRNAFFEKLVCDSQTLRSDKPVHDGGNGTGGGGFGLGEINTEAGI